MKSRNIFKKYIDFIQFPYYRNLEADLRINFNFPLTVFTGQNGCGKSSALHALWGSVAKKTPTDFWFSTKLDPIDDEDRTKRPSLWYGYLDDDFTYKEVVKLRIKKKGNPNYWETSRPKKEYGMKLLGGKRNSPINKPVMYLDFRAELSAFDQTFYFADRRKMKNGIQSYIHRQTTKLNKLIEGTVQSITVKGKVQNEDLYDLTSTEVEFVSKILGRNYSTIKLVNHKLFKTYGYSVFITSDIAKYSEARAGSGEIAIVRLVTEILKADDYTLVLLDEPEVSLHPGAQSRLKEFLLEQAKQKKLQIILNTHSPSLINGLPKEAIKIFHLNPNTNKFSVAENLTPEEAFFHIEYEVHQRPLFVEDRLAQYLVERILNEISEATLNVFKVQYHAGGAELLISQVIPLLSRNENPTDFVIFDGDQKLKEPVDWNTIPSQDLTVENLNRIIKEQTNHNIKFLVDGSGTGDSDQKIDLSKKYLDFYKYNTYFLPDKTPEMLIWDSDYSDKLLLDNGFENEQVNVNSQADYKEKFKMIAKLIIGQDDSDTIFTMQKIFANRFVKAKDVRYEKIKQLLNEIIEKCSRQ